MISQHVKIPRIYATFGEFVAPCKYVNDNLLVTYSPPRPSNEDLEVFTVENKEDPESEGTQFYGLAVRVTFDGGKTFYPRINKNSSGTRGSTQGLIRGFGASSSTRGGGGQGSSSDDESEELESEETIGSGTNNVFFYERASSFASRRNDSAYLHTSVLYSAFPPRR